MAFSTYCNNKGCGKFQAPYIDPQTNKVFCSICDNEISNLSHFTVSQMKANKQFKPKSTATFVVKCELCKKDDQPILLNDNVVCKHCHGPLSSLTTVFKLMLKDKLKTLNKPI